MTGDGEKEEQYNSIIQGLKETLKIKKQLLVTVLSF